MSESQNQSLVQVDTTTDPPRAIWVHPYEDDQFLSEHPELNPSDDPPSYDAATAGHRPPKSDSSKGDAVQSDAVAGPSSHPEHKRGMFGKLKDKAIGTKEEREEQRRIRAEQIARAEEQAALARARQREEREAYMRAHGGYAPYHPSYAQRPGYDGMGRAQGAGIDNTAALLLGGLAGGLLLGDIFGGGLGGF